MDMIIDKSIFNNSQITLVLCFTFISKTGMGYFVQKLRISNETGPAAIFNQSFFAQLKCFSQEFNALEMPCYIFQNSFEINWSAGFCNKDFVSYFNNLFIFLD